MYFNEITNTLAHITYVKTALITVSTLIWNLLYNWYLFPYYTSTMLNAFGYLSCWHSQP